MTSRSIPVQTPAATADALLSLAACICLIVIATHPFLAAVLLPSFDFLDELVLLLMVLVVLLVIAGDLTVHRPFLIILIWASILIGLSILFGRNRSVTDVVLQGILQSKLFFFSAFALIFINRRYAASGLLFLFAISIFGAVLNLVWPGFFVDLGLREAIRMESFSIPRIGGFQLNPNRLGRIMALIPLVGPGILRCSRPTYRLLLATGFILVLATGSRVSIALFVVGLAYHFISSIRSVSFRRLTISMLVLPLLLAVAFIGVKEMRIDKFGGSATVGEQAPIFRILLLAEGTRLAVRNFPIGSGLATYATPFAKDAGVYEETAISDTFFLSRGSGLFDSNLASILGESGFLGLLLAGLAYWLVIDRSIRHVPGLLRCTIVFYVVTMFGFESLMQNSITSAALALFLVAAARFYEVSGDQERIRQWN